MLLMQIATGGPSIVTRPRPVRRASAGQAKANLDGAAEMPASRTGYSGGIVNPARTYSRFSL